MLAKPGNLAVAITSSRTGNFLAAQTENVTHGTAY